MLVRVCWGGGLFFGIFLVLFIDNWSLGGGVKKRKKSEELCPATIDQIASYLRRLRGYKV